MSGHNWLPQILQAQSLIKTYGLQLNTFMYILNSIWAKISLNIEDAIFQKGNKANAACFMFIHLIIRSRTILEKAKDLLVLSNETENQ